MLCCHLLLLPIKYKYKTKTKTIAHDITIFIRLTFFKIVCFSDIHQDEGH